MTISKYPMGGDPLFFEADDSNDGEMPPLRNEEEQLTILHTRALDLLSRCSCYVPENLKGEIYRLADDTGRTTLMPVRVARVGKMIVIDPRNTSG